MLTASVTYGTKVPHPAHEFGSISSSVTLQVELPHGQDPQAAVADAFIQAEAAVRRQLQQQAPTVGPTTSHPTNNGHRYPSGNGRSAPRPASAAQVRYLRRLVDPQAEAALLRQHGVNSLDQLPLRACSEAIDRLKGSAA